MKRIILSIALLTYVVTAFTQSANPGSTPDTTLKFSQGVVDTTYFNPGWGDMDYAVPESPAFKILGTNPDNILHPTSAKAIAFSVGDYFLTSGPVIPKSLAAQFSPFLLANRNTSLKEFNKDGFQRLLSRLSFSIGTATQGTSYSVAEGVNMTILDHTDMRSEQFFHDYLSDLAEFVRTDVDFFRQAVNAYTKTHPGQTALGVYAVIKDDTAHSSPTYKAIDSIERKLIDSAKVHIKITINSGSLDEDIVHFRDSVKNRNWNKAIWQVAIATLQTSSDSLVRNLKFSQIALWSSTGLPLGEKGQILLGGKLGFVDSVNWQTTASLGCRFFYGRNNFKGFLQGEYDYKNKSNSATFSAGTQFNISNGIWGQFVINLVVNSSGKVTYQPGFNVGLGKQEKKKQ